MPSLQFIVVKSFTVKNKQKRPGLAHILKKNMDKGLRITFPIRPGLSAFFDQNFHGKSREATFRN